jgi:ATP-dependent RNA helicase RhlE
MEFNSFNFHPQVAAGVTAAGYVKPTPIQTQGIPAVMQGGDVMGLAQTGTGKTAAFVLPILHRLMQGERGYVRALIVAPTRELAEQINEAILTLGKETRLRSITVYGGVNINPQINGIKRGAEIVVACPGRLLDHLNQKTIDLSRLDVLVLDEADQMFDMGFFPDIRRILKHLPSQRQTLLFSATMPAEIRKLTQEVLRQPTTVQVDTVAAATTVSHALYPVTEHLKTPLLLELLQHTDTGSVLIFTRTKHRAKRLGEKLGTSGFRVASLQGNLSQNRRQEALSGFRDGTYQVLVATDIAARGIDVSQISHVINFDIPNTPEAYIHRIGRTGRAARSGDAFTLVTDEDRVMIRTIEKVLGNSLTRCTVDGFNYRVAAPPMKESWDARAPRPMTSPRKATGGPKAKTSAGKTSKSPQARALASTEGKTAAGHTGRPSRSSWSRRSRSAGAPKV